MISQLKRLKPTSAGTRFVVSVSKHGLWKGRPYKPLVENKKKTGGRNSAGRITSWHKGGGHKKLYRMVDFSYQKSSSTVERVEYDPNRSAYIALVVDAEQKRRYVLASEGHASGSEICVGAGEDAALGNALPLKEIPSGSFVHSIELVPGAGAALVRSAGAKAQVIGQDDEKYTLVKLPSKEVRRINNRCFATLGEVSNANHKNRSLGKAGRSRWMGKRPHVRGVAMNPVDHPHGGGEGKTSGGRHPVSPWGQSAKGFKTRKPKKSSSALIVKRRVK